ncbi:hypothetical protein [Kaistella palustris]|uniref:hypothetical protein n=1 Tax=Kaistella palustris TaxID=493376 RepID=UPI0003FEFE66|nr:hypothetical protein [Kaistella palustris]
MNSEIQYIYSHRAVAFLDVLGFQNKLQSFEDEAIKFHRVMKEEVALSETEEDDEQLGPYYYSKSASEFIETFDYAISKLDKEKFSYYLFSDNICITVKNINSRGEKSLIELLLVISELYFEFVQKGYFLRGGIDYGLFIDQSSIALGVPLATAYKMESNLAVFPRIILSTDFVKQLEIYPSEDEKEFASVLESSLIKNSCEFQYLNIFNHIFKIEEKELFFKIFNQNISENLSLSVNKENIYLKYKWLADEFNDFIEKYTGELAFLDENYEATEEHIINVKNMKISYGH